MVRRAGGDPVPGWLLRKRDHNLCFLEFFEGLKGNLFQAISALKLLAIGSSNKRLHKIFCAGYSAWRSRKNAGVAQEWAGHRVANRPAFVRSSQSLQAVKPAERSGVLLSFSAVFCQTTAKEKMSDRCSHPAIKHSNIRLMEEILHHLGCIKS